MIEGARYYLYLVPCENTKQHIFVSLKVELLQTRKLLISRKERQFLPNLSLGYPCLNCDVNNPRFKPVGLKKAFID